MKAKVFIKYGKREHLQQIVDGSIRFAPSQNYDTVSTVSPSISHEVMESDAMILVF